MFSCRRAHHNVRPSVCHTRISLKLSEIDVWLLGNSNRNPVFPVQSLPSDTRLEVQFRHSGCFWVAFLKDGTALGTVAGQLSSRTIMDDTLYFVFISLHFCFVYCYWVYLCADVAVVHGDVLTYFGLRNCDFLTSFFWKRTDEYTCFFLCS